MASPPAAAAGQAANAATGVAAGLSSKVSAAAAAAVSRASPLPPAARSPIAALLQGFSQVILASLQITAAFIRFGSVTIPSTIYTILHYSFTLQLDFPSLAILFLSFIVASLVWLRYRHLNRYERLKEVPLVKDEGFGLHPDVAGQGDEHERGGGFHNYLDEFLSAIRIFGFLEKPVFHELARHLQTKRIVAGDSLSLDSDFSFYIVIDGNMQVFAPLPQDLASARGSSFADEETSGFQLLNEVGSGGTLSSLFTILSLFTEDVRLGFADGTDDGHGQGSRPQTSASQVPSYEATMEGLRRRSVPVHRATPSRADELAAMRPGSQQLQLSSAALRNVPTAQGLSEGVKRMGYGPDEHTDHASSFDDGSTIQPDEAPKDFASAALRDPSPGPNDLLPPAQASAPFPGFAPAPGSVSTPTGGASVRSHGTPGSTFSPTLSAVRGRTTSTHTAGTFDARPHTPGSVLSGFGGGVMGDGHAHGGRPSDTLHHEGVGTVARATVDTTLAVIPAEAFKRLTKKYPNATAHIVQVILTRLSRVTFHTAHQYLGLTKEVMRTEKHINDLASFPLPAEFYEQGGMEKLRHRFLPEPSKNPSQREGSTSAAEDDYFRGANLGTATSKVRTATSSAAGGSLSSSPGTTRGGAGRHSTDTDRFVDHTPWGHPDPPLRTPSAKTAVGPGDLLSMTGNVEAHSRRPSSPMTAATPRPRSRVFTDSTQRLSMREPVTGNVVSSPDDFGRATPSTARQDGKGSSGDAAWTGFGQGDLANFNLKDALMSCIARSIGLAQAPVPESPHASVSASPFINPADASLQRSLFRSAFSSLSMLDAAMFEEESSVTGASSALGPQHLDLENEVEVRFFGAGSTMTKAGDTNAGLFYIIDGFVDVIVPSTTNGSAEASRASQGGGFFGGQGASHVNDLPPRPVPGRDGSSRANGGSTGVHKRDRSDRENTSRERAPSASKRGASRSSQDSSRTRLTTPAASEHMGNALDGTHKAAAQAAKKPHLGSARARTGASTAGSASYFDGGSTTSGAGNKTQTAGPTSPEGAKERAGPRPIYTVGRGGIVGYLSSLLGSASYVDIVAKTDTYVGFLPASALQRIMERRPIVLLTLSKRLLSLLSPLIIHIDSALDWQHVNAGQVIYREGDPSDSFYIVINGRLRAITEKQGAGIEVLDEYGQGASVGELDVITQSPRRKTLHAIRDSEIARMPMSLFNAISVRHPEITIQISRVIARRVRDEVDDKQYQGSTSIDASVPGLRDLGRNNENLRTVAIVPVTREVPISDFATLLQNAFEDTIGGPTSYLNQSSVMGVLGRHAFNRIGKLKLAGWLAEQEQRHRLVMYVVDTPVTSPWAQTSIRQADCILVVGLGDDPTPGEYERLLLSLKTTARKELVLLHPERSVPSGTTRAWLKNRPWVNAHHHVEMPGISRSHGYSVSNDPKAVQALRNLRDKLENRLQRYRGKTGTSVPGRPHHFSDFARLSRRLCGESIGLVLGGGGARGCAHVGFLRALEERGIPVDMVAGTSIGSLVGGLYAREAEVVTTYGRVKKFAGRMASLWRFVTDLTYPITSYTTGHEFNRGLFKAFGDISIEDFWLPFACNSVNITWSRQEIHVEGFAWRYIRASMTLAGLIPPLVDKGNMLLDGGYVDNLPVNILKAMGAKHIFAVDVGSVDDTSPRSYGDTLSGFWVLINKWNPWSDARNIPSIPDIQGRLTYVSSVKTLEDAKRTKGVLYARMPVEGWATLAFGQFNEIAAVGYEAGSALMDRWAKEGKLPTGFAEGARGDPKGARGKRGGISARRNSI